MTKMQKDAGTDVVEYDRQQTAIYNVRLYPKGAIRISITQIRRYRKAKYGPYGSKTNQKTIVSLVLPFKHRIKVTQVDARGEAIGVYYERDFGRCVRDIEPSLREWLHRALGLDVNLIDIVVKSAKDTQTHALYQFDGNKDKDVIPNTVLFQKLWRDHLKAVALQRKTPILVGG